MPCNTAHVWFDALTAASSVPMLHMVDAVVASLQAQKIMPPAKVGVLATDATIASGLYQRRLGDLAYSPVLPDAEHQADVMHAVRWIKAGEIDKSRVVLNQVVDSLVGDGCSRVILACTELPLAFSSGANSLTLDATEALAVACIRAFGLEARQPWN